MLNNKIIKKRKKILIALLLFLVIITGIGSLSIYNSSFQTLLVQKYLNHLSNKLDTKITVKKIEASLFNTLYLKDLYVEDLHQDTLLYVAELKVDIKEFSIKKKRVVLDNVALNNTFFNLQKYKGEKVNNLDFIIKHFASSDTTKSNWYFKMNKLNLSKTHFNYDNNNFKPLKAGVDYKHISITYLDLALSKINFVNKGIDCSIDRLNFFEKSGFQVDEFTAEVIVSPSGIITQYLKVNTPFSKIDGNVTFLTNTYKDLSNFIEDVRIQSYFNTTKVDFKDIYYFAPAIECLDKNVSLKGEIKGTVSNLKGRKLAIKTDDGTRFRGDADISGLPDSKNMFMHIKVKELITTKSKLESIPLYPFTKETFLQLPDNFRALGAIRFKGNFTGFYHDFVAYGTLKTNLGRLKTDVSLKLTNGEQKYKGELVSEKFNLGKFFKMENELGNISMDVNVDGAGFTKKEIDATLNGTIKQVVVKGYEYNNVEVKGNFKNQIFAGNLQVKDENVFFDFDGHADFNNEIPTLNFTSNIKDAKLAKLKLIKSKKKLKTRLSTRLIVDVKGNNIDDLQGSIQLVNSHYNDKIDSLTIENIKINTGFNNGLRELFVNSEIVDGELKGNFKVNEMANYVNEFFNRYIPSIIDEEHQVVNLSNDLNFEVNLHSSKLLSKLFFNGVELSDSTDFYGNYSASTNELSIQGSIPYLNVKGVKVNQFNIDAQANNEDLNVVVNAQKVYQNDSLFVNNFNITTITESDSTITAIKWKNNDNWFRNESNLVLATSFNGLDHISNKFLDSYVYVSDSLWEIKSNNEIRFDTGLLTINNLLIATVSQQILIDGKISDHPKDHLDVSLKDLNLLTFKSLIPEKLIKLEGFIDGVASFKKKNKGIIFTSDLHFDQLKMNDQLIGKGNLNSAWKPSNKSLKLEGNFYRESEPIILFNGFYYPYEEDESLALNLKLNQAELSMFKMYTKSFLTDINGKANANINLTGNLKKPALSGNLTLANTDFTVTYLNTKYRTDLCSVNISPDMISCDNVAFFDVNNNKANVNGTVYHTWFTDWSVGVGIEANNFLALNTSEKDNKLYYGVGYVSGLVDINSYMEQLTIDVKVKTEKNTVLNIPLTDNEDLVENDFIEFISNDSLNIKKEEEVDLSNIEMNFDLEITPDAETRLIFDDQIGDVMKSTGNGNIKMQISKDGDLSMFGNYVVKDGDYLFTLQNVINKRFDLEEGGTITWSGSPYDAELNLTAIYRLRARLYDLLVNVDTNEIYKKRIPVDLKLHMTNSMLSPDIDFDIALPTADEATKSKVRSVLYVSDKEQNVQELNKQVFSLLVLNSFLPPPGAESAYGRADVGSTTSIELLSNQISNWLSKMSNDFDVGVNIRPGDELSNEEYELALSTQFFNDRLILDGNVGYSERDKVSNSAQNTNNLIGDISIEYKITKDGKLRVKAFNNS
ncbi:MAG: translocation/assembly module TamB domain-containing protein, partial [Vicingaceae bacterium]